MDLTFTRMTFPGRGLKQGANAQAEAQAIASGNSNAAAQAIASANVGSIGS